MRKLSRSFFWIDQEVLRTGIWLKLSSAERLVYIALAASVNREGVSLWGLEKLQTLAGCNSDEWQEGIKKLIDYNLIRAPQSGEIGIILLSLEKQTEEDPQQRQQEWMSSGRNSIARLPIILKTTTTVELGEVNAESKDSK